MQEGLVALWDDMDEPTQGSSDGRTPDEPAVSSKPLIDKLWRRVAHNRLVIGVMLTTDRSVELPVSLVEAILVCVLYCVRVHKPPKKKCCAN